MKAGKRIPMSIEHRAKQFMPFSAVKGLDEAIAREDEKHSRAAANEYCIDVSELMEDNGGPGGEGADGFAGEGADGFGGKSFIGTDERISEGNL